MISQSLVSEALSYQQYKFMLEELLTQGKTTGSNQSEEYLGYAKINLQRMQRLEKTIVLNDELKQALSQIKKHYLWLVLTEGWCGDAAQNLPILHLMEKETSFLEMKLILRDEHPTVMDQYLTNGSRSIPKLICLEKESFKEVFNWGPRPLALQTIVMQLKKDGVSKIEKGLVTQNWYNTDKSLSLQKEFSILVRNL